jgi:Xaa-Pro dipeptidase
VKHDGFCCRAEAIKTPDEIVALNEALAVCEDGLRRMQAARAPDLTEIVASAPGQYRTGRRVDRNAAAELRPADQPLVSGGERPGDRERRHDRLQFRPDRAARLFRRHFAELARRGPRRATTSAGWYAAAHAQVQANIELFRPGMTLREIAEAATVLPER